jgi:P pilus assembly chaperone PapD
LSLRKKIRKLRLKSSNEMKAILTSVCLFIQLSCFAQAAISISTSRIYFAEGGSIEQTLIVENPNRNDILNIKVSVQDWNYDSLGNNRVYNAGELTNSLANYLTINSGNYITLAPGATDTIRIAVGDIPATDSIPVRTAMLYLTQLDKEGETSSTLKTLIQMGVKIYYRNNEYPKPQILLTNFDLVKSDQKTKKLRLFIHNVGNTWLDGTIQYKLLNLDTREMIRLGKTEFFSLPSDNLQVNINLPTDLERGNYKAFALAEPLTNNSINNLELTFTN